MGKPDFKGEHAATLFYPPSQQGHRLLAAGASIYALLLGLTDDAQKFVVTNVGNQAARVPPFPSFLYHGWDWIPDVDPGGVVHDRTCSACFMQCKGNPGRAAARLAEGLGRQLQAARPAADDRRVRLSRRRGRGVESYA